MQLLNEVNSPDGLVSAKIFSDDDTYLTEYWVNGVKQRVINSQPGTSLAEVETFARQWVGSVQTLNG